MQRFLLFVFIVFQQSTISYSQTDKYTVKLEALYEQDNFNEIIKYKQNKTKLFSTRALYIKGMAYYGIEDDDNALKYLNLAIEKGPADEKMFFYKGITHYYKYEFSEALKSMDSAIALNSTNPDFYAIKGEIYLQLEEPDSAIKYFSRSIDSVEPNYRAYVQLVDLYQGKKEYVKALDVLQSGITNLSTDDDYYQLLHYNIGLVHHLSGDLEEAKTTFEDHIELYSDDYAAVSKLIQVLNALGEYDMIDYLKINIYNGYKTKQLPEQMSEMFCFSQFDWNENRVFAFELYEPIFSDYADCRYKFIVVNNDDEMEFKIQTEQDSLSADSLYLFKMIKNDTLYTYADLKFERDIAYNHLDSIVLSILNNEALATDTLPGYDQWVNSLKMKSNKLKDMLQNGSSFEKAVFVKSIPEEYQWLRDYYPGHSVLRQTLMFHGEKPYDVIMIRTLDGETIDVYFDISDFFGKGF